MSSFLQSSVGDKRENRVRGREHKRSLLVTCMALQSPAVLQSFPVGAANFLQRHTKQQTKYYQHPLEPPSLSNEFHQHTKTKLTCLKSGSLIKMSDNINSPNDQYNLNVVHVKMFFVDALYVCEPIW